MNYKNLLLLLSIILFFNSCEDDTDCCPVPDPEAKYQSGIFVLNEGNFGSANASVTYINEDTETVGAGIFNNINDYSLGDTAQSMEMFEDMAIIVVNVSNKIEIVNRYTFEILATINTNLQNPRYAEVLDGNIYVTNWGDGMDPADDFVAIFDLADFSFIRSVPVSEGPEMLVSANNKIFVAHTGGFSFNNIVSVIEKDATEVETEIEVGDLPNSMLISGNDLWVLSGGKPSYADVETPGQLSKIDLTNNEVVESIGFPEKNIHPANLNIAGSDAYFTVGKSVFKYTPGEGLPDSAEYSLNDAAFLYGFEIYEGKIYVASPNADFTGDGNLFIYALSDGTLINRFSVGINPNGIYFND